MRKLLLLQFYYPLTSPLLLMGNIGKYAHLIFLYIKNIIIGVYIPAFKWQTCIQCSVFLFPDG